jgi:hypothetical protein
MITKAAVISSHTQEVVDDSYKLLSETLMRRDLNELRDELDGKKIFRLQKHNREEVEEEWDTFKDTPSGSEEEDQEHVDSNEQEDREDDSDVSLGGLGRLIQNKQSLADRSPKSGEFMRKTNKFITDFDC